MNCKHVSNSVVQRRIEVSYNSSYADSIREVDTGGANSVGEGFFSFIKNPGTSLRMRLFLGAGIRGADRRRPERAGMPGSVKNGEAIRHQNRGLLAEQPAENDQEVVAPSAMGCEAITNDESILNRLSAEERQRVAEKHQSILANTRQLHQWRLQESRRNIQSKQAQIQKDLKEILDMPADLSSNRDLKLRNVQLALKTANKLLGQAEELQNAAPNFKVLQDQNSQLVNIQNKLQSKIDVAGRRQRRIQKGQQQALTQLQHCLELSSQGNPEKTENRLHQTIAISMSSVGGRLSLIRMTMSHPDWLRRSDDEKKIIRNGIQEDYEWLVMRGLFPNRVGLRK